jgi:hypothetical protein
LWRVGYLFKPTSIVLPIILGNIKKCHDYNTAVILKNILYIYLNIYLNIFQYIYPTLYCCTAVVVRSVYHILYLLVSLSTIGTIYIEIYIYIGTPTSPKQKSPVVQSVYSVCLYIYIYLVQ